MSTKAWCFGLGVESVCAFQSVMCFLARSSARWQFTLGSACLASFTRSYHSFKHSELFIKPSAVVLQSPRSRGMTCINSATEKNNMRDCMALASMHGEAPEPTRDCFRNIGHVFKTLRVFRQGPSSELGIDFSIANLSITVFVAFATRRVCTEWFKLKAKISPPAY